MDHCLFLISGRPRASETYAAIIFSVISREHWWAVFKAWFTMKHCNSVPVARLGLLSSLAYWQIQAKWRPSALPPILIEFHVSHKH